MNKIERMAFAAVRVTRMPGLTVVERLTDLPLDLKHAEAFVSVDRLIHQAGEVTQLRSNMKHERTTEWELRRWNEELTRCRVAARFGRHLPKQWQD